MRVGLEASYAFMGRGGIDRYAYELFRALLARDTAYAYQIFTMFAPFRFDDLERAPYSSPWRRKAAMAQVELTRRLWSRFQAPPIRSLAGPLDLVHVVHHFAPPVRRELLVVSIHDLSFEYPQYGIEHADLYARDARRAVARADCVIAVSEFTKREVERLYGVPDERIKVIHEGVRAEYWSTAAPSDNRGHAPYFLAVGKIEPRKNLIELLQGYALARRRFGIPHRLVIVGKPGRGGRAVLEALERFAESEPVDYRRFVSDTELRSLYRNATAFVYPSLYEGFGLPVLEAMAAGAPVIASSAGSLPEVVGAAGVMVQPGNPERWAESLGRMATDDAMRRDLAERGRVRAGRFTWQGAAEQTEAVYRELLGR